MCQKNTGLALIVVRTSTRSGRRAARLNRLNNEPITSDPLEGARRNAAATRRRSGVDAVRGSALGDHRSGADHAPGPDRHPVAYGRVQPDKAVVLDPRGTTNAG